MQWILYCCCLEKLWTSPTATQGNHHHFRGIQNRIPLLYPHCQKAHSKQQERNENTKKKSSVNCLLQLAEGKGCYLYCQQHAMKPQVSKTWLEQQNILWITATGDTFPYACNELEDKFVPHWNFASLIFIPWPVKHVINFTDLINEGQGWTGIRYFTDTF